MRQTRRLLRGHLHLRAIFGLRGPSPIRLSPARSACGVGHALAGLPFGHRYVYIYIYIWYPPPPPKPRFCGEGGIAYIYIYIYIYIYSSPLPSCKSNSAVWQDMVPVHAIGASQALLVRTVPVKGLDVPNMPAPLLDRLSHLRCKPFQRGRSNKQHSLRIYGTCGAVQPSEILKYLHCQQLPGTSHHSQRSILPCDPYNLCNAAIPKSMVAVPLECSRVVGMKSTHAFWRIMLTLQGPSHQKKH